MRVLVSGMIAGDPSQGGATWAVLQYLVGLRRLGHDVVFIEPLRAPPQGRPLAATTNAGYLRHVADAFELEHAVLLRAGTRETAGLPYRRLVELARGADLLLNVSGLLRDEDLLEQVPVRAYLDLDPGFNQVWHAQGIDMGFDRHTHHVTVGQEVGSPGCPVPDLGLEWIGWLPPVVLSHWPVADEPPRHEFTTVGHWRSYGSAEHHGLVLGQKAHSLRALLPLPARAGARFELALAIHPAEERDLAALREHGWTILDPQDVAASPDAYRAFVAGSRAEFGLAKQGYVSSRSGWFSDRSACYLASGRPVLAQDTGFGRHLPTGSGLLAFTTLDEAAAGVEDIRARYREHARAAREVAEEHLDAERTLPALLDRLGAGR